MPLDYNGASTRNFAEKRHINASGKLIDLLFRVRAYRMLKMLQNFQNVIIVRIFQNVADVVNSQCCKCCSAAGCCRVAVPSNVAILRRP